MAVTLRLNEAKSSSPTSSDGNDGRLDLVDLRRIAKASRGILNTDRVVDSLRSSLSTTIELLILWISAHIVAQCREKPGNKTSQRLTWKCGFAECLVKDETRDRNGKDGQGEEAKEMGHVFKRHLLYTVSHVLDGLRKFSRRRITISLCARTNHSPTQNKPSSLAGTIA
jgi:hypothetical protein